MSVYIALLRGINVSGHKLIKMTDLKRMFEDMGFKEVQTYIQSGNVLFKTDNVELPNRERIENKIKEVFGFDVPVVLRTADGLERIIANSPYQADTLQEGESIYVCSLTEKPSELGIDRMLTIDTHIDDYRLSDMEIYILYRQSAHKSKLTNNLFEKKLGVQATTRNWQTMNKLAALGREMLD